MSFKPVLFLLIIIIFLEAWATIGNWYWANPWFDIPMHFLGGFWVGFLFFYLNSKLFKIEKKITLFLFVVSFAAFIGVLWEFFEYLYSIFYPDGIFSVFKTSYLYRDTLGDLFFDILGAIIFSLLTFYRRLIK